MNFILFQIVRPVTCLIVVDVQNDFITGSLSLDKCPAGDDGFQVSSKFYQSFSRVLTSFINIYQSFTKVQSFTNIYHRFAKGFSWFFFKILQSFTNSLPMFYQRCTKIFPILNAFVTSKIYQHYNINIQ